jgi:glycosyltransferase involved in cell wall biosynthesis
VAGTIGPCLNALQQVCDEILLLDSQSDDGTQEICKQFGVKIVQQAFLGFSQTKNLGNGMAKNNWILSIDADEVLSDELISTLQRLPLEHGKVYSLDRLTNYCGQWIHHCGWYPDWKVRLFNRNDVEWQGEFVHETLKIPLDFQVVKLSGKLFHYSYKDSDDHLQRIEKYAQLSALEQFQKGKKATIIKKYLSPAARFFRTYFFKKGYLDGKAGWTISRRNAWMVRLRYRYLQEMWAKNQGRI